MIDNFYDAYMDYTAPFKGSNRYHKWAAISLLCAAMERRCWYSIGGLGKIHPNMYIFLVGGAGTGKSTIGRLITDIAKRYNKVMTDDRDKLFFGPDKFTPAALVETMKECYKKTDKLEQSPMWFYSSELATGIKEIGGGSITDDLLKYFDCDDTFSKRTASGGTTNIIGPCLNILACTTPSFISKFLPREQSGTGLAARIMLVPEFGEVVMDEDVPMADKKKREHLVNLLCRVMGAHGEFKNTKEATEFWSPWFIETRKSIFEEASDTFMRDFLARKTVMARKVAMALSVARSNDLIIQKEDYEQAIQMIDEIQPDMIRCFAVTDSKKISDFAKHILESLPMGKIVPKSVLIRALYKKGITGEINTLDANLEFLIQALMITRFIREGDEFYRREV